MPSTFYLDYKNGNDATTATPLGWWSVAFTGGTGTAPAAGETATGATGGATAKVSAIGALSGGSWAGSDAAGTMYFYGKGATAFQSEQVDFSGGAHIDIAGDFTYCAWKTVTSGATAARTAPGDTIRIAKSPDPTSMGQNATWTNASTTITLTSAVTANIETCEAAWTPSASCQSATDTSFYTEGTKSVRCSTLDAFTTGLIAYKAMAETNFSGYQQVSFAIRPSGAINTNGYLQICLCSDNAGAVPVNTIDVPAMADSKWCYFTVDTGAPWGRPYNPWPSIPQTTSGPRTST